MLNANTPDTYVRTYAAKHAETQCLEAQGNHQPTDTATVFYLSRAHPCYMSLGVKQRKPFKLYNPNPLLPIMIASPRHLSVPGGSRSTSQPPERHTPRSGSHILKGVVAKPLPSWYHLVPSAKPSTADGDLPPPPAPCPSPASPPAPPEAARTGARAGCAPRAAPAAPTSGAPTPCTPRTSAAAARAGCCRCCCCYVAAGGAGGTVVDGKQTTTGGPAESASPAVCCRLRPRRRSPVPAKAKPGAGRAPLLLRYLAAAPAASSKTFQQTAASG